MSDLPTPQQRPRDPFLTALVAALYKCNPQGYLFLCNEIDSGFREQLQNELVVFYKFKKPIGWSLPPIERMAFSTDARLELRNRISEKSYMQVCFDLRNEFVRAMIEIREYSPVVNSNEEVIGYE